MRRKGIKAEAAEETTAITAAVEIAAAGVIGAEAGIAAADKIAARR
jgi:hypothetical protein